MQQRAQSTSHVMRHLKTDGLSYLERLLKKRNLSTQLFHTEGSMRLSDNISEHARWVYNNIYSVPYPGEEKTNGIARVIHGLPHVSSAANHILVLTNLYRRHGDHAALKLTEEDIKLMQIAMLFHDAARKNDGKDMWDHDSGLLCYAYLTKILKVDTTKAKSITEEVINKDFNFNTKKDAKKNKNDWGFDDDLAGTNKYWGIVDRDGDISCELTQAPATKSVRAQIMQGGDCLEIIRARPHFDAHYLDFYQHIAANHPLAFEEMAILITEIRSLIELRGDTYEQMNFEVKKQFEHEDGYKTLINKITPERYPLLYHLSKKGLLPWQELSAMTFISTQQYNVDQPLDEANINAAMREGKIFVRGIGAPSALTKKDATESLAGLELRKTLRRMGTPTRSSKLTRDQKHGNPIRSVSMIGYGRGVFTNAGFMIINPEIDAVKKITPKDSDSGFAKKQRLVLKEIGREEKISQLEKLHHHIKMGGSSRPYPYHGDSKTFHSTHVEILYDATDYQAIFLSHDPCLFNINIANQPMAIHRFAPYLQALYLQNEYRLLTGITLPIFAYSGLHNYLNPVTAVNDDMLIHMWVSMCSSYMQSILKNNNKDNLKIDALTIDEIKTLSMYGSLTAPGSAKNAPADTNYHETLRAAITEAIEKEKAKLIKEHHQQLKKLITYEDCDIANDEIFYFLLRISPEKIHSSLREKVSDKIKEALIKNPFENLTPIVFFNFPRFSGNFDQILTDKKKLLSKEYTKELYYSRKLFRLIDLASHFKLNDLLSFIQDESLKLVEPQIEYLKNKIAITIYDQRTQSKLFQQLKNLINFCAATGLLSCNEFIKKQIAALVLMHHQKMIEAVFCKKNFFNEYYIFITYLKTTGQLTEEIKNKILDDFLYDSQITSLLNNIKNSYQCNFIDDFTSYLKILKFCKISIDSWIEQLLWIMDRDFELESWSQSTVAFLTICKKLSLLNDPDIFWSIIDHTSLNDSIGLSNQVNLEFALNWLDKIEKYTDNGRFSSIQSEIVKKRIKYIYAEKIDALRSGFSFFFEELALVMNKLQSIINQEESDENFLELVTIFNLGLQDFNAQDIEEMSQITIKTICSLHEKLPGKEERQVFIDLLPNTTRPKLGM